MKIMRIELLAFGVEDIAASARYYDDWGLKRVDHGATGIDYVSSGQSLKLRQASDASLPAAVEGGSTLRECVWGVDNTSSLDAIGAELGKDQTVSCDSSGMLHAKDPWGMPIAFQAREGEAGADRVAHEQALHAGRACDADADGPCRVLRAQGPRARDLRFL